LATAENAEEVKMMPFEKCPVCGGVLKRKTVDKLLIGGVNTAIVSVPADVCLHCGERLYDKATVSDFETIRNKLENNKTTGFKRLGYAYKVAV
jgi:YgiT-type zinc finger domain-containing protein